MCRWARSVPQLLAFARNSLREDSHDILKDQCRYGGKVAENIDLWEAVDYGLADKIITSRE